MIGFDFPIRPEWVHDTHQLCQPGLLVDDFIQQAIQTTMQELGGEKTRRNTLGNIIRYLVRTEGSPSSRSRKLAEFDALATASKKWPVSTVKPAYLTRILLLNDVARAATNFVAQRYRVTDAIIRNDIKQRVVSEFGERKVVLNAVSSFVRTLDYFGVCTSVKPHGTYQFKMPLHVDNAIFPLIVLAWAEYQQTPQVDLTQFQQSPIFHFLKIDDFDHVWQQYNGRYWSLETRIEGQRATLKYPVLSHFEEEIHDDINNLSPL